jgi:hypothetical protein
MHVCIISYMHIAHFPVLRINALMKLTSYIQAKVQNLWMSYVSRTVPPEDAACEFECRQLTCSQEEWEICQFRQKIASRVANLHPQPPAQ